MNLYNNCKTLPFQFLQRFFAMNPVKTHQPGNLLTQFFKNVMDKLRQNPEVYPIRYYKKGKQYRRKWQAPLVK
jgi:hypothetical protein